MGTGLDAIFDRALADIAAVSADNKGWLLVVGCLAAIAVATVRVEPDTQVLVPAIAASLPVLVALYIPPVGRAAAARGTAFGE
jgi:hypothetical protein